MLLYILCHILRGLCTAFIDITLDKTSSRSNNIGLHFNDKLPSPIFNTDMVFSLVFKQDNPGQPLMTIIVSTLFF